MMDWHTFGVVAAVGCSLVLVAGLIGSRILRNPVNPVNPVPKNAWMVFLVFVVIATVEAQKPTNIVPQNLNMPMGGGRVFLTGFTGLTGLGDPIGWQGLDNPVNLVNPVQTIPTQTTVSDVDIARGYALVEEDDNAASISIPTNAVTVGNWHRHGARSSIGNHRLDWQGLAAKPNGAPQC